VPDILHIMSSAGVGGGERYVADLIRNSDQRYAHCVILPEHGVFEKQLKALGAQVHIVRMPRMISLKGIARIARIARMYSSDLIHTHGYRGNFYGRLGAAFRNIPTIATIHVSLYDYSQTGRLLRNFYLFIERLLSPFCRCYICISRSILGDMKKMRLHSGAKLTFIANGVDLERFFPKGGGKSCRSENPEARNAPIIGAVGRMVPEKGQTYLIDAVWRIKPQRPELLCLLAGDGPLLEQLERKAAELGLSEVCHFLGIQENILQFYQMLDILVLPSLREPFGLVILEAMACGVPVIATDAGGPRDIIVDGYNGLLVPAKNPEKLAEAIERLLRDRELALKLRQNALETVRKQYDVRKTVRRVEKIYRSVMDAK
jgi:glycosyltransferase involved in cell wall biosynthesis